MLNVKVLGSGCKKCNDTAELIKEVAAELNVEVNVEKETSPQAIMGYGVMSTPAVVVDDVVVHSGSKPEKAQISDWLNQMTE